MTSFTAGGCLSPLMAGMRGNSSMAREQAMASRPLMVLYMRVNSLMENIMVRESTDGRMANNTRASLLKIEAMASVNKQK